MIWDLCKKANEFLYIHIIHFFMACFQSSVFAPFLYGHCRILSVIRRTFWESTALPRSKCSSGLEYSSVLTSWWVFTHCNLSLFFLLLTVKFRLVEEYPASSLTALVRPGLYNSRPTADCLHGLPVLWEIASWTLWGTLKSLVWVKDN